MITSLHRLRSGWMAERTARLNALRGLLRELGVFIPVGARRVVPAVWALVEDADSDLPDALRWSFAEACQEIRDIEARIKQLERQLETMAQQLPVVSHLLTIPGIGLLTATALFAFVGNIHRFPSARQFASWLGLTPREHLSGLKRSLGGISKRRDGYLRMLLIHGARSVILHARKEQPDHLRHWAHTLEKTHVPRRLGGLEPTRGLPPDARRRLSALGIPTISSTKRTPPRAATASRVTAEQVGPAQGQPITSVAIQGRCHRLAPLRADSVIARESQDPHSLRPEIRLQSVPFS